MITDKTIFILLVVGLLMMFLGGGSRLISLLNKKQLTYFKESEHVCFSQATSEDDVKQCQAIRIYYEITGAPHTRCFQNAHEKNSIDLITLCLKLHNQLGD